jgi:hypothetical protein
MPRSSQSAAILRRVASPPGEDGRMRRSASSALRPFQCQPPIVLAPAGTCRGTAGANILPGMSNQPRSQAWAADDPRQHARQRRAVARGVLLAVPPPCGLYGTKAS